MRPQDLDTLGFESLLDLVGSFARSGPGREACRRFAPRTEVVDVREELALLSEFTSAVAAEPLPLGDFPDIRELLNQARTPGVRLSGTELREVAAVISTARRLRGVLRATSLGRARVQALVEALHALPDLDRKLAAALDEEGSLRDDASPALRAVRREIRRLRADVELRLGRFAQSADGARVVADEYVTLRAGRYVIPVRAAAAGEVPGIVQDRSASGETWFVEPLFAVESNNQITLALREEQEEELRVLAILTESVAREAGALAESVEALARIDSLHARTEFARAFDAIIPEVGGEFIRLRGARHPLLLATGRPVVPVDLELEPSERLLLITGPNTGGKSVAMKTLGLSVLAVQAGVPVPADPDALLPCFTSVLTDVGDPQTVSGDLSTFSGHVVNLKEILERSNDGALVLVDEPGASTDPDDGAALANSVLAALRERGARVLATTHFPSVKVRALSDPSTKVASVDFDPESFAPRYRFVYGAIGPSLGLEIARRLGMPESVLVAAENARDGSGPELRAAVDRLEAERRRYETREFALAAEEQRLARLRTEQESMVADLRKRQLRRWEDELSGARRFATTLREAGQQLLDDERLDRAERARRLRAEARNQLARIDGARRAVAEGSDPNDDSPPPQGISQHIRVSVGQSVVIPGSGLRGEVVEIRGDRVRVVHGAMRIDVPAAQIQGVLAPPTAPVEPPRGRHANPDHPEAQATAASAPMGAEINLLGQRVPAGLAVLEKFLDRALLENIDVVRIVHGSGTGALRHAVRGYLADCVYVAEFRSGEAHEGGSGVTMARLR